jgi:hypothetical protein
MSARIIKPTSQQNLKNIFNEMKKCRKIKLSILSTTPLNVIVPSYITELNLVQCNVKNLSFVTNNNLSKLTLPVNKMESYDLTNCKKLKWLYAENSQITNLPTLNSLEYLDATSSQLEYIEYQPKILTMNLDYSKVKTLPQSTTLTSLSVADTQVTKLPNYTSLEFLCTLYIIIEEIPKSITETIKTFVGSYHPTFTHKPLNIQEYFVEVGDKLAFHAIREGAIKNVKPSYECETVYIK